jgi:hypothetical protein
MRRVLPQLPRGNCSRSDEKAYHASLGTRHITGGSCVASISLEGQADNIPGGKDYRPMFLNFVEILSRSPVREILRPHAALQRPATSLTHALTQSF